MPRTYYLSNTDSDLTGGADFNEYLLLTTSSAVTINVSVASVSTETSYGFTEIYEPGASGLTGNYTASISPTTANSNIFLSISFTRINSSGVAQSTSATTAEQSLSTGVKTFT